MSKPKLETYQNKQYFVDQYSGVCLKEMYSVPKNKKGDREGVFHDPAVALRYFYDLFKEGKINEKKYEKIQKAIAKDLHVKKQSLKEAPVINPLYPDFTYLSLPEYKFVLKSEDVMITVEEFLQETVEGLETKDLEKEGSKKQEAQGCLYTVKPDDTDLATHVKEKQSEFLFNTPKSFNSIAVLSYNGKRVWVITDSNNTDGLENQLVADLFGIKAKGVVYLCSQKPIHFRSKKRKEAEECLEKALEDARSPKKKKSCLPLTLCGESTSSEEGSETSV